MELQLQVTEEELLEFPEIRPDQINTSHTDNSAGEVILSAEKSSYSGSCIAATPSKIKAEKPHHRQQVVHRRQPVTSPQNPTVRQPVAQQTFECRKQKDSQLPIHTPTGNVHTPSIFDIQVRPKLMAFAKTLTPEALRYLYLGIDLGRTIGNCSQ